MMAFLTSRIGKLLITLIAAAGILFGTMQFGAGREREAIRVEQLEVFIKTEEVIKNVKVSPTRDAAISRLRDNGWVR